MPLSSRRRSAHERLSAWPGWVDALSALLMVIIFVLLVFTIAQATLQAALGSQDEELQRLRLENRDLRGAMAAQEEEVDQLGARLLSVGARLEAARAETVEAEQEAQSLRQRLDAAERLDVEIRQLNRTREDLAAEIAALRLVAQDYERRLEGAEEDQAQLGDALRAARTEADAADSAAEEALTTLALTRGEVEALKAQLAAAEEARQTLSAERDQLQETATRVEAAERARDAALARAEQAQTRLAAAETALTEARQTAQREVEQVRAALAQAQTQASTEVSALQAQLNQARTDLSQTQALLTNAQSGLTQADSQQQQTAQALADSRQALQASAQEIQQLKSDLEGVRTLLRVSESTLANREETIQTLTTRLNTALAEKVEELESYRSEFFGRMRSVLGDRDDIRIEGDRFVLQSEVLFDTGEADLNPAGQAQLSQLAQTLQTVTSTIPSQVDWILRVDGHTDVRPMTSGRFASNWELSAARAITVVRYLEARGFPPQRLVAAGFGEHQPIDTARTQAAFARNRRIEIKLDSR